MFSSVLVACDSRVQHWIGRLFVLEQLAGVYLLNEIVKFLRKFQEVGLMFKTFLEAGDEVMKFLGLFNCRWTVHLSRPGI